MKIEWEQEFTIRSYEVDFNNKLKVSSIFDFMQIVAGNHADYVNFGFEALRKKELYWVLSRMKLKVYSYLPYETKIKVLTWAKGSNKLFALRDFILTDKNDKKVAEATSAWVLLNSKTKRPQKFNIIPEEFTVLKHKHAIEEIPNKIKQFSELEYVFSKKVAYNEIDINKHVNNTKYVEWVQDAFDEEMYNNNQIKSIQVNFLSECKMGQTIKVNKGFSEHDKNVYYIEGVNNENEKKVFQSKVVWK